MCDGLCAALQIRTVLVLSADPSLTFSVWLPLDAATQPRPGPFGDTLSVLLPKAEGPGTVLRRHQSCGGWHVVLVRRALCAAFQFLEPCSPYIGRAPRSDEEVTLSRVRIPCSGHMSRGLILEMGLCVFDPPQGDG